MIGVNSQIESPNTSSSGQAGNVGIGFAIPADTVKSVVAQLKATGKASHAYLGVSTADASGAGAQVAQVTASGPAANGGLAARRRHHLARRQGGRRLQRADLAGGLAQGRRLRAGRGHPQRLEEVR